MRQTDQRAAGNTRAVATQDVPKTVLFYLIYHEILLLDHDQI